MLDWLSKNEMVSLQVTEVGTLITVPSFADYQDSEAYRIEPGTGLGTHSEQQRNNRKKEKKGNTTKSSAFSDEVVGVFDYWQERRSQLPHTRPAKLTDERLSKVKARLDEGRTPEELRRAVDGCLGNEYNVQRGYYDLELICRDDRHVSQYLAWGSGLTGGDAPFPKVDPRKAAYLRRLRDQSEELPE